MRCWTEDEDQFLRDNWDGLLNREMAYILNRTIASIEHRAARLGIRRRGMIPGSWTEEEIEILKSKYPVNPTQVVRRLLPRSYLAIYTKASDLGLRKGRGVRSKYHWARGETKDTHSALKSIAEQAMDRNCIPTPEVNEDLAYVVGVYFSDGYIENGTKGQRFCLSSVTPRFNREFEKALKRLGYNPWTTFYPSRKPEWAPIYRTICYGKHLYEFLHGLGPKSHPNLERLSDILDHRDMRVTFLRGIYEGDGHRNFNRGGVMSIGMTSRPLVKLIHELLLQFGFSAKFRIEERGKYKTLYRTGFTKKQEVIDFLHLIEPSIKGIP